jgi:aryl-alcohol dehydrogenase-like predicted oxidoreductase
MARLGLRAKAIGGWADEARMIGGDMEKRRLGRLEHMSSVLIYGGAALADVGSDQADASIAFALESGINHFDTSDDYGDSEVHLGRWMPRVRDEVFLATKTTERSRAGAATTIRRSLERLNVERVDLLQLHAVCTDAELDAVTGPGGALEAVVAARDEGLVGGVGITGHGVGVARVHLEGLRRFPFDTVLTPYSHLLARDPRFRAEFDALAAEATANDVALMLIKYMAKNLWRDTETARRATWYEPLEDQAQISAAGAFALARREATGICTAGDVDLLPRVVEAAAAAPTITMEEAERVLEATEGLASPFVSRPGRSTPEWLEEPV